ncbi:hypothetical protein A2Z00_04355 [Candidatus Gottesmanbacteria bacterium RBG_13_45_10]|uniref:Polymerase beta nucleotidyltransferase domain-containing protein n=1 Tax=Candidatus Gottesmanbacteria bacterium RBG_13_45_10 TaxID=1798370 RepID=A0A1F5ZHW0_9BACT|nr:MAG: hypothetical protein A2Z00_04355 [Candidatus Gottesmanbacteria bacterium RBG_13_45_10]
MDTLAFTPTEEQTLRALGVSAVVLFGSRAREVASKTSDYDIGIVGKKTGVTYDSIYDMLASKIGKLVDIDIVFLGDAPMELQHHAASYGRPLFEAKPGIFASYKEAVMDKYADFAPIRQMFQQQILGRIPA